MAINEQTRKVKLLNYVISITFFTGFPIVREVTHTFIVVDPSSVDNIPTCRVVLTRLIGTSDGLGRHGCHGNRTGRYGDC